MQESTIGAAFFTQALSLNDATIKFDIWDTAGQERYYSLAPMYYRGAAAAVVVYDITSMVAICQSFENFLPVDYLMLMFIFDRFSNKGCACELYGLLLSVYCSHLLSNRLFVKNA